MDDVIQKPVGAETLTRIVRDWVTFEMEKRKTAAASALLTPPLSIGNAAESSQAPSCCESAMGSDSMPSGPSSGMLLVARPPLRPQQISSASRQGSAALRLLLAVSNESMQRTIRNILNKVCMQLTYAAPMVTVVDSGADAVAAVEGSVEQFDCALLAIDLPVMSGAAAALEIRRRPATAGLPIFAITSAKSMPESFPGDVFASVIKMPISSLKLSSMMKAHVLCDNLPPAAAPPQASLAFRRPSTPALPVPGGQEQQACGSSAPANCSSAHHSHKHRQAGKSVGSHGAHQMTILIAEDSLASQMAIKRAVRMAIRTLVGSEPVVHVVGDGAQAVRAVAKTRYDIVLTDIYMPEMTGVQALEAIRATHSAAELPVIALTGTDLSCESLTGFTAVANKPLGAEKLIELLQPIITKLLPAGYHGYSTARAASCQEASACHSSRVHGQSTAPAPAADLVMEDIAFGGNRGKQPGHSILLVGNDKMGHILLKCAIQREMARLSKQDPWIVSAHTGSEARNHINHTKFDLVFLDMAMLDSESIAADIRSRHSDCPIPVVAIISPGQQSSVKGIAKEAIEKPAMDGEMLRVLVDNLPRGLQAHSGSSDHPEPSSLKANRPLTCLLAEDNHTSMLLMTRLLAKANAHVIPAINGAEAVTAIKANPVDMVFMDCNMPVKDGWEATRDIRAWEKENNLKRTPIIAVTANAMVGDREKCLACGMDDYVAKPVHMLSIMDMISKWEPEPSGSSPPPLQCMPSTTTSNSFSCSRGSEGVCTESDGRTLVDPVGGAAGRPAVDLQPAVAPPAVADTSVGSWVTAMVWDSVPDGRQAPVEADEHVGRLAQLASPPLPSGQHAQPACTRQTSGVQGSRLPAEGTPMDMAESGAEDVHLVDSPGEAGKSYSENMPPADLRGKDTGRMAAANRSTKGANPDPDSPTEVPLGPLGLTPPLGAGVDAAVLSMPETDAEVKEEVAEGPGLPKSSCVPESAQQQQQAVADLPTLHGMSLVYIDECPARQSAVAELLGLEGLSVQAAAAPVDSAAALLPQLVSDAANPVHAVLLGPEAEVEGGEELQGIHEAAGHLGLPVVAMASQGPPGSRQQDGERGNEKCMAWEHPPFLRLSGPFSRSRLLEALRAALSSSYVPSSAPSNSPASGAPVAGQEQAGLGPGQLPGSSQSPTSPPVMSLEEVLGVFDGDWEFVLSLLDCFLGSSGQQSAELMEAALVGDLPRLKFLSHSLLGASRSCYLTQAAHVFSQLESYAAAVIRESAPADPLLASILASTSQQRFLEARQFHDSLKAFASLSISAGLQDAGGDFGELTRKCLLEILKADEGCQPAQLASALLQVSHLPSTAPGLFATASSLFSSTSSEKAEDRETAGCGGQHSSSLHQQLLDELRKAKREARVLVSGGETLL